MPPGFASFPCWRPQSSLPLLHSQSVCLRVEGERGLRLYLRVKASLCLWMWRGERGCFFSAAKQCSVDKKGCYYLNLSMVMSACNAATWEAVAGGWSVQSQLELHRESGSLVYIARPCSPASPQKAKNRMKRLI